MMKEQPMPMNVDAEKGVIGSILIDPEAIVHVIDTLQPNNFYRDIHQVIYQAIVSLYKREIIPDYITLTDELERTNKLEMVGGGSYIAFLVNFVPTSNNITLYADIVQRTWKYRELLAAAAEITQKAYEEEENALAFAEKRIFQIGQGVDTQAIEGHDTILDDYMTNLMEIHDRCKNGTLTGIPTGFPLLNSKLGGFRKYKMYVLAARPGEGKTSLLLNWIDEAVKKGCNVLFFSLEMDKNELMQRWVAMHARIDSKKLRDGRIGDDEWERVMAAHEYISSLPGKLYIDDTPRNTATGMRSKAMRLHAQHGIDMIGIDYLQKATVDDEQAKRLKDHRLEIEEISQTAKTIARELEVPVIALAQMNREVETRSNRMPQLSDLKEASGIEQDADVVMFIHKSPEIAKEATEYDVSIVIEKNRDGDRGIVPMRFVGPHTRFYPIVSSEERSHE